MNQRNVSNTCPQFGMGVVLSCELTDEIVKMNQGLRDTNMLYVPNRAPEITLLGFLETLPAFMGHQSTGELSALFENSVTEVMNDELQRPIEMLVSRPGFNLTNKRILSLHIVDEGAEAAKRVRGRLLDIANEVLGLVIDKDTIHDGSAFIPHMTVAKRPGSEPEVDFSHVNFPLNLTAENFSVDLIRPRKPRQIFTS